MTESKAAEQPSPTCPIRLLLVDDNPADRELLARELGGHFHRLEIEPVRDSAELESALCSPFDAAVVDYHLRWTTGIEVLRRIKQRRARCPVLMFTASGSEEIAVEAMKEGLDDYITKTAKHYARLPYALAACLERAHERCALEDAVAARSALTAQVSLGERRLQLALEAAGMIAWEHDPPTDRLHLSSNVTELAGASWTAGADAIGAIHPEDLPRAKAAYEAALAQGQPFALEMRAAHVRDGREIWFDVRGQPLRGPDGAVALVIGVAADVSERKRAEAELRLADRRKDAFLATLAHELRNPLAPIRYATRLLEPSVPPQMAADARSMIDRQLAQMSRLLDDLLDVSRITRGVLEIRRELLDFREILEAAIRAAQPLAEMANHSLEVDVPQEPLPVRGDAVRLTQAIGNLLHNAMKYTPAGGKIGVTAAATGPEIVLRIRDNGIGIPREALATIFDLFVQVEPVGTRAAGGLGIGLSLARDLARLHGGTIEAHSAGRGCGSEFIVRLPRAEERPAIAAGIAAAERVEALGASGVRVLIVDDNIDAAVSLSYVLTLAGYQANVAHEGAKALEMIERLRPAVVLLDIGLPDVSGHEVARRLRREAWGRSVRLIAITGWGQESDRAKSIEAGFDEHLTKPIDPQLLLERISHAARGAA